MIGTQEETKETKSKNEMKSCLKPKDKKDLLHDLSQDDFVQVKKANKRRRKGKIRKQKPSEQSKQGQVEAS